MRFHDYTRLPRSCARLHWSARDPCPSALRGFSSTQLLSFSLSVQYFVIQYIASTVCKQSSSLLELSVSQGSLHLLPSSSRPQSPQGFFSLCSPAAETLRQTKNAREHRKEAAKLLDQANKGAVGLGTFPLILLLMGTSEYMSVIIEAIQQQEKELDQCEIKLNQRLEQQESSEQTLRQ